MGFGHIKRSIWLSQFLEKELGYDTLVIFPKNTIVEELLKKEKIHCISFENEEEEKKILTHSSASILFVDKRDTHRLFYKDLPYKTIGLDNYGKDSFYFDYTINPIPYIEEKEANFKSTQYFFFPDDFWSYQKPKKEKPIKKILLSFGGADPKDFSFLLYQTFERINLNYEITFVLGPLYEGKMKTILPSSSLCKILGPQESLYPLIAENDCVFTSFGITAFEAFFLNKPVLLLNPSDYHQKLSDKTGFPSFVFLKEKNTKETIEELRKKIIDFLENPVFPPIEIPPSHNALFKNTLKKILAQPQKICPICQKTNSLVLKRNQLENLYFCEKDRIFFRNPDYEAPITYSSNYFLEDYKKQYGKTYEEDRPNIDRLNLPRIQTILKWTKKFGDRKKNLLEVGSAMGFFLDMARKTEEFDPYGIEISEFAAAYTKEKLKIPVENKDFLKTTFERPFYDVLAMWYYMEHNKNLSLVIKKIKEALKKGGILALATPNADGISSRKDRLGYAQRIPADHYYEFSIDSLVQIFSQNGFRLLETRITGIHPKRWFKKCPKILFPFVRYLMRKKQLGDTFELYLEKIE